MSPRLPAVKPKQLIRALERAGFLVHHTRGSHVHLKHPTKPQLRITVPSHSFDVPAGTLTSVLRQAALSRDELLNLL